MNTITYTKLRSGAWGVRGPAESVRSGSTIVVSKRDGSTKTETVGRVLWTGDGIALASLARSKRSGRCTLCDEPLSAYARRRGYRRCLDCVDGGARAHGGQSYYDRNGNFVLGEDD